MKKNILFILTIVLFISCKTQKTSVENKTENNKTENAIINNTQNSYSLSMKEYELGNYKDASVLFQTIIDNNKIDEISTTRLYNGACIFALAKQNETAIQILDYLASNRFYSNYNHITSDTDLNNVHSELKWKSITEKVAKNKKTEPERLRQKIKTELFKAKEILFTENGKLWGENIWSDNILVLGFDNTIYTTKPLQDSKTSDSIIYYKKIPENTLGFSNAAQKYNGKEYAVVLTNYLDDNSATIIHELFHVLQHKHISLNGNPIQYLDNYDAREWLRLEYQALKNALNAINHKKEKIEIGKYATDAVLFRKVRQSKYKEYLQKEIEIETSEGLANYTGFILSTYPNKYEKAISEINQREQAQTYTRPFPYATGPAYGLIFDYLKINWKIGLDTTYNFLKIYETKYLKKEIKINDEILKLAQQRNNYQEIHQQELDRKVKNEKIINYYSNVFIQNPTLTVKLVDDLYGRTFDMNGTIILKDKGIVYSMIKGVDGSKNNFGDFSTIKGKEKLGVSGVLYSFDGTVFTFPKPIEIEKNRIIGKYYEIELNEGWEVVKVNEKGDLEILKKKE
ncbi:MAG TPA: hypothetical protein EYG89_04600 [Bacteroidia bacterium]|nr:hypothetical protein [Bacteroidia bacterium]